MIASIAHECGTRPDVEQVAYPADDLRGVEHLGVVRLTGQALRVRLLLQAPRPPGSGPACPSGGAVVLAQAQREGQGDVIRPVLAAAASVEHVLERSTIQAGRVTTPECAAPSNDW